MLMRYWMRKGRVKDVKAIYQKMADSGKLLLYLKGMEIDVVTSTKVPEDEVLVLLNPKLKQDAGTVLSSFKTPERMISDVHKMEAPVMRGKSAAAGSIAKLALNVQVALRIMLRGSNGSSGDNKAASQIVKSVRTRLGEGCDHLLDNMKGVSEQERSGLYASWHSRLSNVVTMLESALSPEGGGKGGTGGKGTKEEDSEAAPGEDEKDAAGG